MKILLHDGARKRPPLASPQRLAQQRQFNESRPAKKAVVRAPVNPPPRPLPAKKAAAKKAPFPSANRVRQSVEAMKTASSGAMVPVKRPKLSKTDVSALSSIVGDKVGRIQDLLEDGNFESATNDVHKALLQTLIDVLPYAEHAVRKSEGTKGVYQINSLMSMILETLNSARAQSDRGQLGHHLIERVIQPAFKLLAEAIVREFMALDTDLATANKKDVSAIVREARGRLASSVQDAYGNLRTETIKFISG